MLETRPRTLLRAVNRRGRAGPGRAVLRGRRRSAIADRQDRAGRPRHLAPPPEVPRRRRGWYDEQVLTVDLANGAVKSDLLTAPKVAQGEAADDDGQQRRRGRRRQRRLLRHRHRRRRSRGGEIQAGDADQVADLGGWAHVGVSKDGIGQLVDLTLQASADAQRRRAAGPHAQRGQRRAACRRPAA